MKLHVIIPKLFYNFAQSFLQVYLPENQHNSMIFSNLSSFFINTLRVKNSIGNTGKTTYANVINLIRNIKFK